MRNLLFLSICALTTTVFSTNYYVSNTGNDSNNGRSPSAAWRTLANVNSGSFDPGDSILFNRGDEWVGERLQVTASGTSGGRITYSAYGTGAKPILSGIDEVAGWTVSGNWTDMGSNVWRISTYATNYGRVWIDGVEKERSQEAVEGTGVTAAYPWQKTNNRLYIYSAGNPASTYSSIKISGEKGFFADAAPKNFITLSQ